MPLVVAVMTVVLNSCSKSRDLCTANLVASNQTDRVITAYRVLSEGEDYRDWTFADQNVMPSNVGDDGKRSRSCLYTPKLNGPENLYPGAKLVVGWQIENPVGWEKTGDEDWYTATVEIPRDIPKGSMTLQLNFLSGNRVQMQIRVDSREHRQMLGEYDTNVAQGKHDIGHEEPQFKGHAY